MTASPLGPTRSHARCQLAPLRPTRARPHGPAAQAETYIAKERDLLRWRSIQYQAHVENTTLAVTKLRTQKDELEARRYRCASAVPPLR